VFLTEITVIGMLMADCTKWPYVPADV